MRPPDSPLRIALLSYRGKPNCGGQGVYVRHLSRELHALGHQVDVIAGPPYPVVDRGVRLHRLPGLDLFGEPTPFRTPALSELRRIPDWVEFAGMRRGRFAEPLAFSFRARSYLRRYRDQFDLVHDNQGLGYGLLNLGLPTLATVHHPIAIDRDLELRNVTPRRQAELRRWYQFTAMQHRVARTLPAVLAVSHASKAAITAHMRVAADNVDVVPVGVDHTMFRPDRSTHKITGRIVTTASADVPLKGLPVLLRAFALVRSERTAELVVVGSARPDGPTAQLIDQLGLTAHVRFRSGLSDTELADLIRGAQVACVPSLFEGFSLPTLEAMACGTALVTTTAGAIPEVTGPHGDAALHVHPADSGALAAALTTLLEDSALRDRLGDRGVARAAPYTWHATARETEAHYRSLLRHRGQANPTRSRGASLSC
ncbi:glycosyl transferase family 1 [Amycolatopsis antarctica]|uniref:Glycosyl transferase family 1 n=1 Tax=Amycolatopsis antarctica TaxID=1854586 RepID=A0A263D1P2_9PSEU|nr:glycosyltransferase family 4 protein [Amycolatopsis antarctica]OZM72119.1 glycosyl transferase family 1 [Amycolatopsis antarctica]